jgi:2,3-bisphosphoglycerate-dependent phosphoglycerate mutase/probable phosphoglycerate mutase
VRHGQTQSNLEHRYQGRTDSPLTTYGQQQLAALAARLRRIPFTAALASPASRTQQTAQAILEGRRGATLHLDARWAEIDHGSWEGLTYQEVMERDPDDAHARWSDALHGRARGGESLAELHVRVTEAWHALLQDHTGGRVLLVTHATPIQLLLCSCLGLDPIRHWNWRIDLGSLTCLDLYPSGVIIRMVNEVPRLRIDYDAA